MANAVDPSRATQAPWRKLAVLLGALSLGLAGAVFVLAREVRRLRPDTRGPQATDDPADPAGAVADGRFDPTTRASWDSHPDADVVRVLQPRLSGDHAAHSNRFGLSERDFQTPKPDGMVRVVLLGDSFVHGAGVEWPERAGAQLEALLRANSSAGREIEVLHVGISSWNIRAECAFLRRSLTWLAPDLVVHVLVFNDLDDTADVRGFGGMANFSAQHRERANSLTSGELAVRLGAKRYGMLGEGLDHESRERFASARAELEQLEAAVRAAGGEYLALFNWTGSLCVAAEHLARGRDERGVLFLSDAFATELRNRISDIDPHWSVEGHRAVASVLYGAIQERGMLATLALAPVEEHAQRLREIHTAGAAEATREALTRFHAARLDELSASIALPLDERAPLHQIHAGIEKNGALAPYFSCILAARDASAVRVRAERLGRAELQAARVRLEADEFVLGELELGGVEPLDVRLELPSELRARPALTVRLISDDYAYLKDLRRCAVLTLRELALE